MTGDCSIKHCRKSSSISYLGQSVCQEHWEAHCDKKIDLKKELGVK